jgi:hypothetical protein
MNSASQSLTVSAIDQPGTPAIMLQSNESAKSLIDKFAEYKDHPAIPALPQSTIYDLIIDTVYSQESSQLQWPSGVLNRIMYFIKLPLVLT